MLANHVLVGAGNIKSTLKDLMNYLRANMGFLDTELNLAIELAQRPRFNNFVYLGWFIIKLSVGQIITWHGGATVGHITFIGFNRSTSTGVVILYNWTASLLPQEVGMRIFEIAGRYEE